MLKSMTGFGKSTGTYQTKKVSVEVRSLNSKSLDLNLRIPSIYKEIDADFRKMIADKLGRGKIDVSISIDSVGAGNKTTIDMELAKSYYNDLKTLGNELDVKSDDYLAMIMRMPEIYSNTNEELADEEKLWVSKLVEECVEKLDEFRKKEGRDLNSEFTQRIEEIRSLLNEIPKYEEERLNTVRERMLKGLEEIKSGSYDENRFEQEMIFYIEKLDVTEEKMRLANHLDYFLETMELDQSGKKLGFIGQEIGREINTLGSKSNHAEMQKLVIEMKDKLEKIKEQVLNTL